MRTRSALTFLVVAFVGCISIEGGSWGGGSEGGTTSTRNGTASSKVVYLTRDSRKEVLLLVEGSGSGGVSGGNPPSGTIWTPNGRIVNWSCPARHGKLRELRIDGVAFPLESGRVFHIDVRNERVIVHQINLDPDELVSGPGSLRENLRASAPISAIIAGFCDRTNPPE